MGRRTLAVAVLALLALAWLLWPDLGGGPATSPARAGVLPAAEQQVLTAVHAPDHRVAAAPAPASWSSTACSPAAP